MSRFTVACTHLRLRRNRKERGDRRCRRRADAKCDLASVMCVRGEKKKKGGKSSKGSSKLIAFPRLSTITPVVPFRVATQITKLSYATNLVLSLSLSLRVRANASSRGCAALPKNRIIQQRNSHGASSTSNFAARAISAVRTVFAN